MLKKSLILSILFCGSIISHKSDNITQDNYDLIKDITNKVDLGKDYEIEAIDSNSLILDPEVFIKVYSASKKIMINESVFNSLFTEDEKQFIIAQQLIALSIAVDSEGNLRNQKEIVKESYIKAAKINKIGCLDFIKKMESRIKSKVEQGLCSEDELIQYKDQMVNIEKEI